MKGEDILYAMDGVEDAAIAACLAEKVPRRQTRWPWLVAAVLALVLGFGLLALQEGVPVLPRSVARLETVEGIVGAGLRMDGAVVVEDKATMAAPHTTFVRGHVILARAVEVLPDAYTSLPLYNSYRIDRYRIFRLEVVDGLDTGLSGEIWFAIPEEYYEDLRNYELLMLGMDQLGLDYPLQNTSTGELTYFNCLFDEYAPWYGDIIAFRDGVFDVSLWKCESWQKNPFCKRMCQDISDANSSLLVGYGDTVQQVLEKLQQRREAENRRPPVLYTNDLTGEAAQTLAWVQARPREFLASHNYGCNSYGAGRVYYTRYIGGCPTNEFICIDRENGTVERSAFSFTEADLEALPDISAYIQTLDLDALTPPHRDVTGRTLACRIAKGWYEKTEEGVVAIVKVVWYYEAGSRGYIYDDLYIHLTLSGAQTLSREELTTLIGPNDNIYDGSYDPDVVSGGMWQIGLGNAK